eukprot:11212251-Lingulodinium_polyedra.AAC.1
MKWQWKLQDEHHVLWIGWQHGKDKLASARAKARSDTICKAAFAEIQLDKTPLATARCTPSAGIYAGERCIAQVLKEGKCSSSVKV